MQRNITSEKADRISPDLYRHRCREKSADKSYVDRIVTDFEFGFDFANTNRNRSTHGRNNEGVNYRKAVDRLIPTDKVWLDNPSMFLIILILESKIFIHLFFQSQNDERLAIFSLLSPGGNSIRSHFEIENRNFEIMKGLGIGLDAPWW